MSASGAAGPPVPRILVAPDAFKGTLSAREAALAIRDGLLSALPSARIEIHPMADGGEDTAELLMRARGGNRISHRVTGPLPGTTVEAGWVLLPDADTAVVEMAAASGLTLLTRAERDPGRTTTRGTGELIRHSVDRAVERIWLTVGGSATVDGGTGAAAALGWRFLDRRGKPLAPGGGDLPDLHAIEPPESLDLPPLEVWVDVTNPLCGERGAARVFGPQKGASADTVQRLEAGLERLARIIESDLGLSIREIPGGGAAGGLAAGAVAFFGARIAPGAQRMAEATGLTARLEAHTWDWLVTGEGRFDESSLRGKVVDGVLQLSRPRRIPVAVVAGTVAIPEGRWRRAGVKLAEASGTPGNAPPADPEEALRRLRDAARRLGRRWAI